MAEQVPLVIGVAMFIHIASRFGVMSERKISVIQTKNFHNRTLLNSVNISGIYFLPL
jgi:hypothetical protein